jgi:aspartyl-tRNA(Asn)/glutamyl-tRNA(Gln) amidotransferase subunit A
MDDVLNLSLCEVAAAIRERRLTSVEVTRACLARAEACQTQLNTFISMDAGTALEAAATADAALARGDAVGPLHGVPLAHKDMFYRQGRTATCGSIIRRNFVPDCTATVLRRLDDAGALDLGGLNMSEFAAGPTGHNEHYGHCHNPWNTEHISGGSSSGSGASTAARLVFGAMGSDTGGSVRLPAAMCGVVGLKPTYGRISRYGGMPRAWSMDTMGPLARTVADCALLTQTIAGSDPDDASSSPEPVPDYLSRLDLGVKGWRIGVPRGYFYEQTSETVGGALEESLQVLEAAGAKLVAVDVPDIEPLYALGDTLSKSEAASIHGGFSPAGHPLHRGTVPAWGAPVTFRRHRVRRGGCAARAGDRHAGAHHCGDRPPWFRCRARAGGRNHPPYPPHQLPRPARAVGTLWLHG